MSEALTLTQTLAKFNLADSVIQEMAESAAFLSIANVDDSEGLKAVHDARMTVRATRLEIDRVRVRLKKPSLERGQAIDAEANRLTGLVRPIEEGLHSQEKVIQAEKDRLKAEAQARIETLRARRMTAFRAVQHVPSADDVATMDEPSFEAELAAATEEFEEAEAFRLAEEEERQEKLRAERAERQAAQEQIDRDRAELREAQARLEMDRAAVEAAKAPIVVDPPADSPAAKVRLFADMVLTLDVPEGPHRQSITRILEDASDAIIGLVENAD